MTPPVLVPPAPDRQVDLQARVQTWIGGLVLDLLNAQATIAHLQAELAQARGERVA